MCDDQGLKDDCPCRVSQPMLQRSKDLCYTSISSVGCDQNVLDVLRLRRSELSDRFSVCNGLFYTLTRFQTFCFVPPFTDFSNDPAIVITGIGGHCRERYERSWSKPNFPPLDNHHRGRGTFPESTDSLGSVTNLTSSWQVHGKPS